MVVFLSLPYSYTRCYCCCSRRDHAILTQLTLSLSLSLSPLPVGVPIKHNHRVEFPMAMDLKEYCEDGSIPAAEGCHYSLRGALVHLGASANQVCA